MTEMGVVVIGTSDEQRSILQMQIDATAIAKATQSHPNFPVSASDLVLRRIQEVHPDVAVVDIPKDSALAAIRAIELLRSELPNTVVFAAGDSNQPQVIIAAMRAGAREFLERPTSTTTLLEAFARLSSSQRKAHRSGQRGKIFTFVNAKGGCGATTMAVNTALALQKRGEGVALVDLAPLGHASLHLNAKPSFNVLDAVRNVQRLDHALLDTYMTRCVSGLHLLAGAPQPLPDLDNELPRLFDVLSGQYRFVVVDASTRLDRTVRLVSDLSEAVLLVATMDVTSLWSAAKLQRYLGDSGEDKVKLLINRFRKIPGFSEQEVEALTHTKIVGRIPNQYAVAANAIDQGTPVVEKNHSEMARSFVELAGTLGDRQPEVKRKNFSLFGGN
jgi:pilus assembly protein CpaE